MQNIVIVCEDKDLRKDVSRVLATELNFLYVDINEILDYELLLNQEVLLLEANNVLQNLEKKSIERALSLNDSIITLSRDVFVSNDNFRLFKDCKKVFIELSKGYFVARYKGDKSKLEQDAVLFDKINKIVGANCNITIEKHILTIQEISSEIIKQLNIK